jgi:hypothetical protein
VASSSTSAGTRSTAFRTDSIGVILAIEYPSTSSDTALLRKYFGLAVRAVTAFVARSSGLPVVGLFLPLARLIVRMRAKSGEALEESAELGQHALLLLAVTTANGEA